MTYYEQKKEAISSLHLYSNNSLKNEKRENLRAMKSGNFCMDEQSTLHAQMASKYLISFTKVMSLQPIYISG